ncbi:MAG TPA: NADH-quinone oxidoreductase subunit J, partial [Aggregatilineales bacterium]|nr:NADH-quinone oxidoreductase subunit J [Aggregatilineales bacterium]
TAGVGILEAEVSTSQPEPIQPMVRVVNAASGLEAVEVSLNGEPITEEAVDFQESSDLVEREAGAYTMTVSVNGEAVAVSLLHINDPMADLSLYEQLGQRLENGSIPAATLEYLEPAINLENDTDITLLLTALPDGGYGIIPVTQNLNAVEHDKIGNIQLVNAMPGINAVDLADITEADRAPRMVVENVQFGEFSEIASRRAEHEDYAVYPAGLIRNAAAENEDFKVRDVEAIAHLQEEDFTANTSALFVIAPALRSSIAGQEPELMQFVTVNRPRFGSPTSIGQLLYTGYMLPFQVIALLLLVAMIGAIVLTRDQVAPPRKRFQRRLANVSSNPLVGED